MRRHRERQQREELLAARLMSVIVNFSICAPKEPTCPADFLPKKKESDPEDESEAAIAERFNALFSPISVVAGAS